MNRHKRHRKRMDAMTAKIIGNAYFDNINLASKNAELRWKIQKGIATRKERKIMNYYGGYCDL